MIANIIIIIIGVVLIIGAFVLVKNNNALSLYSVVLTIIGLLFAIYPFLPFKTSSITSIQFKYENVEMYVGQEQLLQIEVLPQDAKIKGLSWKSSNPGIVKVDKSGTIEAISAGEAVITVEVGKYSASCMVTVMSSIESIQFKYENVEMYVGQDQSLQVEIVPQDASTKNLSWESSNPNIVSVDDSGTVKAISTGDTIVTVEAGNCSASCTITVKNQITSIQFEKKSIDLDVGESQVLHVTIEPEDTYNQDILWKSSNLNIVTVDEKGVINAISKGTAIITAETGNISDSCKITVNNPITGIRLDIDNVELNVGESKVLHVVVEPKDADIRAFLWETSNPNIVTVDEKGVINAISKGTATITVAAGNYTDSCQITVNDHTIVTETGKSNLKRISIDSIRNSEDTVAPLILTSFVGSVSSKGQKNDHSFSPTVSGRYRFEFTDIADGVDFDLWICKSNGETIDNKYNMDTGDGITVSLDAGSAYIIRVGQYNNFGTYSLIVGEQKPIVDVSGLTKISDSIQYTDQENNYAFSATVSGIYRFEFSNVPDGTDFQLIMYNSGWELIDEGFSMDTGDGFTIKLQAGKNYFIKVKQYEKTGNYSLSIGKQKEIIDVTAYDCLSDSIQFKDQRNNYKFVAAVEGIYRFEFADVPEGTDLSLVVYNSGWELIDEGLKLGSGDGITMFLSKGKEVFISVGQYYKSGPYLLLLGKPNPIEEISNGDRISGNIGYKGQRDIYLFEAKSAGKYSFTFSKVPEGVYYSMTIKNSGNETIKSYDNMSSGDGLKVNLEIGQKIYICISQYTGKGDYNFIVSQD